jgi:POLQ-like helicase
MHENMQIVGALADLCNGKYDNEELEVELKHLQNSLKLGLSSSFELWLHSKGYVDREICKLLSQVFDDAGVNINKFKNNILEKNSELVSSVTSEMPTYFSQVQVK